MREDKEFDELWKQFMKLVLEIFGFPVNEILTSKGFNKLYGKYKQFNQNQSFSAFGYWMMGLSMLNILYQSQK